MDQFIIIAASIFMLLQVFVDVQGQSQNGRRNNGRRNNGRRNNGRRNNGNRNNGRRNNGRRNNGRRNNGNRNNGRRNNGRRNNGRRNTGGGGGGFGGSHTQNIQITGNGNTASNVINGAGRCNRGRREITEKVRCDFNIHDLNDDGVIPYDEFVKATSYLNQFDKPELFRIFDNTDGNGLITPTEFRVGAQILTNMNLMDQCNFQAIADGPCFD